MIKVKLKGKGTRRINDYRTSRMFARMLSIFGWAFLIAWLILGVRYGIPLGQEIHALVVKFVWGDTPLLLVNLFLVMWLLALIMFGFMFVVAGQGMRAVFEMLGVQDVVAKSIGTSNAYNMIRATFDALKREDSPRSVAARRGLKVSEIVGRRRDGVSEVAIPQEG